MSDNPYASPNTSPQDKFAPRFNTTSYVYKPLFGLLLSVKVLAILTTIASIAVTAVELAGRASSSAMSAAELADTLTPFDMAAGMLALILIPLNIAWNIIYLVATYRISANSHALGNPRPEITPGFAVGSYFIPILNLFKPYQAMKECYTACRANGGSLLGFWWAAHIVVAVLSQISTRLSFNSMSSGSVEAAASMQQIAIVVDVIALPVLIALAVTSQLVLSRLANVQATLASGKPAETGWSPSMIQPPPKPLSNWGGD